MYNINFFIQNDWKWEKSCLFKLNKQLSNTRYHITYYYTIQNFINQISNKCLIRKNSKKMIIMLSHLWFISGGCVILNYMIKLARKKLIGFIFIVTTQPRCSRLMLSYKMSKHTCTFETSSFISQCKNVVFQS